MSYTPVGWASDGVHPLSQANMKTLDAGIASAHDRWVLQEGSFTGDGPLDLALPASHGYSRLHMHLSGSMSAPDYLRMRINGASTTHLFGFYATNPTGAVIDDVYSPGTSSFLMAEWGGAEGGILNVVAQQTPGNRFTYESVGTRISATSTAHRRSVSWGRLGDTGEVTAIRFLSNTAATVLTCHYRISGLP